MQMKWNISIPPVAFYKQFTRNLFNKRSLKFFSFVFPISIGEASEKYVFKSMKNHPTERCWDRSWEKEKPMLRKRKSVFLFSNQKPKEMKFIRFCWFAFPFDYIYTSLYLLQFLLSLFKCTDCCLNTVKFRLVQKYFSFHFALPKYSTVCFHQFIE